MNSRQRRLRAIELSLTPQQVFVVWLRNALQAGTFEESARHSPPHRVVVANAIYDTVRSSMKGQPDPLVDRAIRQAQQEADLLYLLVIYTNAAVLENYEQRKREFVFLLGYLTAEMDGKCTEHRVQILRTVVLVFLKSVIILDAAIAQAAVERLNGQPMLFRDCEAKLKEQVHLAEEVTEIFNFLARSVGSADIDLEEVRKSLQSESDRMISLWVSLARQVMLSLFGTTGEMHAAMDQVFLLCELNSREANHVAPG
jgi:hypothetical protein